MSEANPYAATTGGGYPVGTGPIRKVDIRPIELFRRAYEMIGDQYWLFFGITVVGILVGSLVPLGILMGPIMVGIYLCLMDREAGRRVEFNTLFKGFDQFMDGLIAILCILAFSLAVLFIFGGVFAIVMVMTLSGANGEPPSAIGIVALVLIIFALIIASVAIYIPFVFSFQLIADRRVSGLEAVKQSWAGVKTNLGGVIFFMIVNMIVSSLLACLCYVPAFLFMPISFGALFLMYRDIYGPPQHTDPTAVGAAV